MTLEHHDETMCISLAALGDAVPNPCGEPRAQQRQRNRKARRGGVRQRLRRADRLGIRRRERGGPACRREGSCHHTEDRGG